MSANPQKENGFTGIANEILDEIAKRKFNGTQFRIIMVIWRYTYGFQRKSHDFSLTFLINATGLNRDQIKRELKRLVDNQVINVVQEATFNTARQLAFNKNYDAWLVPSNEIHIEDSKENTGGEKEPPQGANSHPVEGANSHTPQGANLPPKKESIKENLKESNKEEKEDRANPFTFWEQNGFGFVSPHVAESIGKWIDEGCFDEPESIIIHAMKQALENNIPTWNYVNKVLVDWANRRLRALSDVLAYQMHFKSMRQQRSSKRYVQPSQKDKLPEWIENQQPSPPPTRAAQQTEEEKRRRTQELLKALGE